MICKKCGKEVDGSSRFCTSCVSQVVGYDSDKTGISKMPFIILGLVAVIAVISTGGLFIYKKVSSVEIVNNLGENQTVTNTSKSQNQAVNSTNKAQGESGNVKIYEEKESTVKNQSNNTLDEDKLIIENCVHGYIENFAVAVNNYDFYYISGFIKQGSSIYKKQKGLIDSYRKKSISVSENYHEVLGIEADGNGYKVKVKESYEIYKDGGIKTSNYTATYKLVFENEKWLLTDIITN